MLLVCALPFVGAAFVVVGCWRVLESTEWAHLDDDPAEESSRTG